MIGNCLKSLHNQTYTSAVEIIVVDNNSIDSTANVAKDNGATVYFEPKPGVCSARQKGTEEAHGTIIVSTDADTTFPADWLCKIADAFLNDPQVIAVVGPCVFVEAPWWGKIYYQTLFTVAYMIYSLTGKVILMPASNTSFKKAIWSGYNTGLSRGGDEFALLNQFKKSSGKIVFLNDNFVFTSSRRLKRGFFYNLFVVTKMRFSSQVKFRRT